jgi:hypothetical protein
MNQDDRISLPNPETDEAQSVRKPYHKPVVRYEQVFETSAIFCGKNIGGGGGCRSVPRTS